MKALVELLRPVNAVVAAWAAVAGFTLASGGWSPWNAVLLTAGTTLCITAFGNVLNDLHDVHLDRTAHPRRPLPSGRIRPHTARIAAIVLLLAGTATAWWVHPWQAVAALAVAGLLFLYERVLKSRGLPGNLVVAFLTAATFGFGALAAFWTTPLTQTGASMLVPAMAMAGLANLARELAKDIEDETADRAARRTFVHRAGRQAATRLAGASALAALLASAGLLPAFFTPLDAPLFAVLAGGLLVAADGLVAVAILRLADAGRAQRLLRLGMIAAVAGLMLLGMALRQTRGMIS